MHLVCFRLRAPFRIRFSLGHRFFAINGGNNFGSEGRFSIDNGGITTSYVCRYCDGTDQVHKRAENSFNHSANRPQKGTKFRSQFELLFYYIKQRLTCHHVIRSVTTTVQSILNTPFAISFSYLLLNPGHMTTCRRCRLHLVLIPTIYFLLYIIHYIRHGIRCHDSSIRTMDADPAGSAGKLPLYRETDTFFRQATSYSQ